MSSGSDEVEQSVNTIIAEAGVTLDAGLLCEDIIVLSLEVANDFTKASVMLVVIRLLF
jgi:hypothetical protein